MGPYLRHLRGVSIALTVVGIILIVGAIVSDFPTWLLAVFVVPTAWHALLCVRPQVLTDRVVGWNRADTPTDDGAG